MKVVVNRRYGGFGLSQKAYERLIELGVPVKEYVKQERDPETGLYLPQPLNDGEVIFDRRLGKRDKISDTLAKLQGCHYWETWISDNRAHPLLIQVVEELGQDANGRFASLEVVEIPDDVEWQIREYDGSEEVEEKHRSW